MTAKLCIITANLGSYDPPPDWAEQAAPEPWEIRRHYFTDANFPPRALAMTSRLQPGLLKMLGWEFLPGWDAYLWVDASRSVTDTGYAAWMIEQLGHADMAVYRHPQRKSAAEEADYMLDRMRRPHMRRSRYLISRYAGEWIEEQLAVIPADPGYADDRLYASTALIYRPTGPVRAAMREWWYHKTRYCLHDQLALPYVLWRHGVVHNVIGESVYDQVRWEYSRPRGV